MLAGLILAGRGHAGDSPATSSAATHPDQARRYAIAPGALIQSLQAIAQQSGSHLDFDPAALSTLRAGPIRGRLSVGEALQQALRNSDLLATELAPGEWRIRRAVDLDRILVVAHRDQAETQFKADRTDTSMRTDASLMDTPGAVTIITGKVLETQQSLSVRDALANVSGIAFSQSPQGRPSYTVRGFSSIAMVNGVADSQATLTNVFGIERIEVLKGPQAILAGANALGGGVNVVTKKPQADPIQELMLQYATYGDLTLGTDLSGALTQDKRLTYRLTASKSQAGSSQGGFDGRKDDALMPQLRWKDQNTDVIVGVDYGKQHQPVPQYTFADGGQILPVPKARLGNADNGFDSRQKRAFYQLEQKLSPAVTLVSRGEHTLNSFDMQLWQPLSLADGRSDFYASRSLNRYRTTSDDSYLRIKAGTGKIQHTGVFGVNVSAERGDSTYYDGSYQSVTLYPYTKTDFQILRAATSEVNSVYHYLDEQIGVYANDLMSYDKWNLLLGIRRSRYAISQQNVVPGHASFPIPKQTSFATSPNIGLVYDLRPDISLYASYARAFRPQQAFRPLCSGGNPPPTVTTNKELGAKFDLLDNRLGITAAAFQLAMTNSLLLNGLAQCQYLNPSQVTRGVELDIQGQLSRGWNVLMNYSYSKLRDESDPGRTFVGIARNKLEFWTLYDLPGERLRGFSVGLGADFSSPVSGYYAGAGYFAIPSQWQLSASTLYKHGRWNAIFGIKNLTDRRLYSVSGSPLYVPVLPGRTATLTIKYDLK